MVPDVCSIKEASFFDLLNRCESAILFVQETVTAPLSAAESATFYEIGCVS